MRCGYCGRNITAEEQKGHVYYHCTQGRGLKCKQKYFREEEISQTFEEILRGFKFDEKLLEWTRAMLKAVHVDKKVYYQKELSRLQAEYTRNQTKLSQIVEERLADLIDTETVKRKATEIKEWQEHIKAKIESLEKDNCDYIDQAFLIFDMVQNLPNTYSKASPQNKHKLLRILFASVIIKDGKFLFNLDAPFDVLYKLGNSKGWLLGQDSNLQPIGYKHSQNFFWAWTISSPVPSFGLRVSGASPRP